MTSHTSLQLQGCAVHVTYDLLPNNVCTWSLDTKQYKGVDDALLTLTENLLRQHYTAQIQADLLEHSFYSDFMNNPYDIPLPFEGQEEDI